MTRETRMLNLSKLLLENGLPDQPVMLIEAHRNFAGSWRIKFSYDESEPLSLNAEHASELAVTLLEIGEDEMASEIREAVGNARRYATM